MLFFFIFSFGRLPVFQLFAYLGDRETAKGFVLYPFGIGCIVPFLEPFVALNGVIEFGIGDATGLREHATRSLLAGRDGLRITMYGIMGHDGFAETVGEIEATSVGRRCTGVLFEFFV